MGIRGASHTGTGAQLKPPFILGSTGFSSRRTERDSEVHTMSLKWGRGPFSRDRSHSSFPAMGLTPPPPDLTTILTNHHCSRPSSFTTLVPYSMHEKHCPVYSVHIGFSGVLASQQQEVPIRETTLDSSLPSFIVSPSQCHTAVALSSTQVHGGSLGPLLPTHFSRLTLLPIKSDTKKSNKTK